MIIDYDWMKPAREKNNCQRNLRKFLRGEEHEKKSLVSSQNLPEKDFKLEKTLMI